MKDQINAALRTAVCGAIAASTIAVAFLFGVIAAFLWTQQHYDTTTACLVTGGVFLAVGLIALITLSAMNAKARRRRAREEAEAAAAAPSWLTDPAMLLTGIQIARTIGLGRIIPLALAGLAAFGVASAMGGKRSQTQDTAEAEADEASDRAA